MLFEPDFYFLAISPPTTEKNITELYGLDVMGQLPPLHPINSQYKNPTAAPATAPIIIL